MKLSDLIDGNTQFFVTFADLHAGEPEERRIECDRCGGSEVHLEAVALNRGGRIDTFDSAGHATSIGRAAGRGVRVAIQLACEGCSHRWATVTQFHKGATYARPVMQLDPQADGESPATLWRD